MRNKFETLEHEVLALLDGENQIDNVVNIATTNYPERLGARVINRPSRFDEVRKIGMPTEAVRMKYLKHILFREEDLHHDIARWVKDTDGLSIAHLRELAVAVTCLGKDYEETLKRLKSMTIQLNPMTEFKRRPTGFKNESAETTEGGDYV